MNAKIFVVCHDPKQIDERIFQYPYVPICVGAKKDEFSPRFLRDDRGDNIADKNDVYNEMTAVYSVYKHIDEFENTDLIGFVHYRRFFAFSSNAKIYNERSSGEGNGLADSDFVAQLTCVFARHRNISF